jgi:hypothetical protein
MNQTTLSQLISKMAIMIHNIHNLVVSSLSNFNDSEKFNSSAVGYITKTTDSLESVSLREQNYLQSTLLVKIMGSYSYRKGA